jgi:hypothetical protein
MQTQLKIAISGKIGHGKDTLAVYLQELIPDLNQAFFAKKVKEVVALMTNTSFELNCMREGKAMIIPLFGKTLGQLQQEIGTKMREVDSDIWIKALFCDLVACKPIVITDMRFKNEFDHSKKNGFITVRIHREGYVNTDGRDNNHISETDLDEYFEQGKFDVIIQNNADLNHLKTLARIFTDNMTK